MAPSNSDRSIRPDIVEAAAQVFGAHGYERATLDEIAARVGMQKGSLYYHIDSKEQLLLAIHDKLFQILTPRLTAAIEAAASDPIAELQLVIRAIVDVVSSNRDAVRVVLRDRGSLNKRNSQHVERNRAAVLKILEDTVKRVCREEGTASAGPAQVLSYGIMGMTYFVSEWVTPGQHSVDAIAKGFAKMVIDGLRRSPGAQPPSAARKKRPRAA